MADAISVLVVGGGIVGRSVAYHLARAGADVQIVDGDENPSPTSRASLGILTHFNGGDDPFSLFYRDSHAAHGELAEQLREETGMDVGFLRLGGIDLSFSDEETEELRRLEAFNQSRKCPCEWVGDTAALRQLEPSVSSSVRAGLLFPDDHRVSPEALGGALLKAAVTRAAQVAFGTQVIRIDSADSSGVQLTLRSDRGERSIGVDVIVLAAGAWTGKLAGTAGLDVTVRPIRGQQCRFRGAEPLRHILRHDDSYLLPEADEIVAGSTVEDVGFDLETTTDGERMLTSFCNRVLEKAPEVVGLRAGLRPKARKGRAVIGPLDRHGRVFAATGHYRNGVLMGPLTGQVVADWITRGDPQRDMSCFAPKV